MPPSYADLQSAPDGAAVVALLTELLGPGVVLSGIERLVGGIDNGSHHLIATDGEGARHDLVLRRLSHRHSADGHESPDRRADREWRLLRALTGLGIPAPRPRWVDAAGTTFGASALLYDYVTGCCLDPTEDRDDWVRDAARALYHIHSVGAALAGDDFLIADRSFDDLAGSEVPARFAGHRLGPRLLAALRTAATGLVAVPPTLIHGDYWGGNTVWQDGALRAVIDWDDARRGDPAADVGYMWMDLGMIGRRAAAEQFVREYSALAGGEPANLGAYKLVAMSRPLPDPARFFPTWDADRVAAVRRHLTALIDELT